jgi:hypothetical protein
MFGTSTYRDTDWFQFTLVSPTTVTYTMCASFPPLIGFLDASLGCTSPAFITYTTGLANTPVTLTYALPAGTYWAFAAQSSWAALPCGAKYVATLWDGVVPVQPMSWGTLKALYR